MPKPRGLIVQRLSTSDTPQTTPSAAMIEAGAIAIFAERFGPETELIEAAKQDWHNFLEADHEKFRRQAAAAYRAMEAARAGR